MKIAKKILTNYLVYILLFILMVFLCIPVPTTSASAADTSTETYTTGVNTGLRYDDQVSGEEPIGFTFNYFGTDYTTVQLTTNGLLAIGSGYGSSAYSNYALSSTSIRNTIAPFWDDLVEEGYSTGTMKQTIYYQTVKLTASGEYVSPSSDEDGTLLFIAQWTNEYYYSDPDVQMGTFQVILYETGEIQIQYRTLIDATGTGRSYGSSATIGIINSDGSQYYQYSYNTANAITEKQAICYTPDGSGGYTVDTSATYEPIYLLDPDSPSVPQLTSGVLYDGAINVSTDVVLEWAACENATSYRVLVSTDPTFGTTVVNTTTTETSYTLTGLDYGTTYYWRIEAINDSGSNMSDTSSFTTVSAEEQEVPAVTTGSASSLRYDSAVLNGTVTNYGMPAISQYGFVWNTTGTPTISDNCIELGTRYATGDYTADMTGLQPDTTYYVRAFATNDVGTSYGDEISFTTSSYPVVTFTVDNGATVLQGASISIHSTTLTTGSDGTARISLPNGTYSYTVSDNGYTTSSGSVTLSDSDSGVSVSLSKTTYSVTISVTDGTATVDGATVSIDGTDVTTDSNGHAVFTLAWDNYDYTISKAGYTNASGTVSVTSDGTVSGNATDMNALRSAYTLTIAVTDGTTPVDGATVNIGGTEVTTDASGHAVFSNMPWGDYDYTISKEYYTDTNGTASISSDGTVSGNTADLLSARSTYAVTISVTDGTTPIEGATVNIDGTEVTTDSDGHAAFTLPWGDYDYTISKAGYTDTTTTVSITNEGTVSGNTTDINASRSTYALTIAVTDGTTPLEGATVNIGGTEITTDSDGHAAFTLPWGDYDYTISKAGYTDTDGSASITSDGTITGDSIDMNASRLTYTLTIAVTDGTTPVQDAAVSINGTEATTGVDGNAVFNNLPWGDYDYTISKPGYTDTDGSASITSDGTVSGNSTDMNASRSIYTLTISVMDGTTPLEGATVNIDGTEVTTDASGNAVFNNLPWDDYDYTISKAGYTDTTNTASIASDGTASGNTTDMNASRNTYPVTISVTDGTTPLEGSAVNMNGTEVTTDSDGNAAFTLPWGDYDYTVSKAGYTDTINTVSITSDGTITGDSIDMNASRSIYTLIISVKDGTTPVNRATVSINGVEATTDKNGHAMFNLPWGDYDYTISKPRYTDTDGAASMASDGTVSGNSTDMNASRSTYVLTITVTDGTTPLGSAAVTINNTTVLTDANGNAVFSVLPWGDYDYTVSKAGYADTNGAASMASDGTVSGNSTDMNASRSTSALTISVMDGTTPVVGATVTIGNKTVKTDENGNAVFTNLPWGDYDYTVTYANYNTVTGTATCRMQGGGTSAVAMTYSDSDGDGVPDIRDQYPNDSSRSYDESTLNPDSGTSYTITATDESSSDATSQSISITSDAIHDYQSGDSAACVFDDVTVTVPVEILDSQMKTDPAATVKIKLTEIELTDQNEDSNSGLTQLLTTDFDSDVLKAYDVTMVIEYSDGTVEEIHQLNGEVKVSISLDGFSDVDPETLAIYYYDTDANTVEDMGATYDAETNSLVFYTTHFSEYVIAASSQTGNIMILMCSVLLVAAMFIIFVIVKRRKNRETEETE